VIDFFTFNGETSIKFLILVIIPGSDMHGPAVADANQVQREFKIKRLETTAVD
jgi:hypothetical protein